MENFNSSAVEAIANFVQKINNQASKILLVDGDIDVKKLFSSKEAFNIIVQTSDTKIPLFHLDISNNQILFLMDIKNEYDENGYKHLIENKHDLDAALQDVYLIISTNTEFSQYLLDLDMFVQ